MSGQERFDLCEATTSCGSDCVSGLCVTGKCEDRFLAASGPDGNNSTKGTVVDGANTVSSSLYLALGLAAMALQL